MDGLGLLYLVVLIVVLICQFAVASVFQDIVVEKGYESEKNRFFWWVLLFAMYGVPMVLALPDKKLRDKQDETNALLKKLCANNNSGSQWGSIEEESDSLPEL